MTSENDHFAVRREALQREHEKVNIALSRYHKQLDGEFQRLANLDKSIVTYNLDDDEPSIQVKPRNAKGKSQLEQHVYDRLEILSKELEQKFRGACLAWVEKESTAAEKRTVAESSERYLGLYESMVKRLQKLKWEILNADVEEARQVVGRGGDGEGADEETGDEDIPLKRLWEQKAKMGDGVSGGGDTEQNEGTGVAKTAEKGTQEAGNSNGAKEGDISGGDEEIPLKTLWDAKMKKGSGASGGEVVERRERVEEVESEQAENGQVETPEKNPKEYGDASPGCENQ